MWHAPGVLRLHCDLCTCLSIHPVQLWMSLLAGNCLTGWTGHPPPMNLNLPWNSCGVSICLNQRGVQLPLRLSLSRRSALCISSSRYFSDPAAVICPAASNERSGRRLRTRMAAESPSVSLQRGHRYSRDIWHAPGHVLNIKGKGGNQEGCHGESPVPGMQRLAPRETGAQQEPVPP